MALPARLQPDFKARRHAGANVEIWRVGTAGGRSRPQAAVCSSLGPSPGCLSLLLPETYLYKVGGGRVVGSGQHRPELTGWKEGIL